MEKAVYHFKIKSIFVRREVEQLYEIVSKQDKDKWSNILKAFHPWHDVYSLLAYAELYSNQEKGCPELFVYHHKNKKIVYPYLLRRVDTLPFVKQHFTNPIYDIVTPYGFGGPVYQGELSENEAKEFRSTFEEYCQRKFIITEFTRFHPLTKNDLSFHPHMKVEQLRKTVSINLSISEEDMFNNFHSNHRRNVRKAIKNNLTFEMYRGSEAIPFLPTFIKLYYETMDKNNAKSYYYFSEEYFNQLIRTLKDHVTLSVVRLENEIIASALFFICGPYMHYHLGCSNRDKLNLGTNPFLFFEAAKWGKENGARLLHLGGGYQDDDPLFTFKKRFNEEGISPFYAGKKIHLPESYHYINRLWKLHYKKEPQEDYFPIYRQTGE
jgi:hypothetical protein